MFFLWYFVCDYMKVLEKNSKIIEKNVKLVLVFIYYYNMLSIIRIVNKGESFRKFFLS